MAEQPESKQPRPDSAPKIFVTVPEVNGDESESKVVNSSKQSRLQTVDLSPATGSQKQSAPNVGVLSIDEEFESDEEVTVVDRIHRNRKPLSSFLISLIAHTTLLVALALVVYRSTSDVPIVSVTAEFDSNPAPVVAKVDVEDIEVINEPDLDVSPIEMDEADLSTDVEQQSPQEENSLVQTPSENTNPTQATELTAEAPNQLLPTGGGLEGRDTEARARLAAANGGSRESEAAVELGLQWIIRHQQTDGSWHLMHDNAECNGQCKNPGMTESTTAATGLSLLALLGAGYTHQVGPYQEEIREALDYLISRQRVTKYGGSLAEGSMYAHGISTLALSEALIMTRDKNLVKPTQLAMQYIISAQHKAGGWRYNPGEPGDMTVSGWQIMALKSCKRAGFEIPRKVFNDARSFLDSKAESGGAYYGYLKPGIEASPTAIGLLCQMYLGWTRETEALATGADRLLDFGHSKTDVYFNYYATQVLHHLKSDEWKEWNRKSRDYLVSTQEQRGHQTGSWFFPDKHGRKGGRLYTTAMSVMILEVYYRYLPLYDELAVE